MTVTGSAPTGRVGTAPALLLEQAAATPERVALRALESGVWVEYGWADLVRTVARVADLLGGAGVTAGSVVGVVSGSRAEWAPGVWAVQAVGATAVALTAQCDDSTFADVVDRRPAGWIIEGPEAWDRLGRAGVEGTPVLAFGDVEAAADARNVRFWQRDVVDADATADESRLAGLRRAVDALDPDTPALVLAGGVPLVWSHRELAAGADGAFDLADGDEYLSFLPPTWLPEARVLLGGHPRSGATVSFGSHVGVGLSELAAIQPTAVQAPAEWWDALAARVQRAAAEPGPFARKALQGVVRGETGGGFAARAARRAVARRHGVERLRSARSFGAVADPTTTVLKGLGIDLGAPLERPAPLEAETTTGPGADGNHADRNLEEAR